MVSKTKYALDFQTVCRLFQHAGISGVEAVRPLGAGEYNAVYEVTADGRPDVVKVAPKTGMPVMTYEKDMMSSEVYWYEQMRTHTSIRVPQVFFSDFSRTLLDADWFIMEKLPGVTKDRFSMTPAERQQVQKQLAAMAAELHAISSDKAGYIQNGLYDNWYLALCSMVQNLLNDAARKGHRSRRGQKLLKLVQANRALLEPVACTMVNFDIWDPNILCTRENGQIKLSWIDPERSFWGDPILDFFCLETEKPLASKTGSLQGYNAAAGHQVRCSAEEKRRLAFGHGLGGLIMEAEKYYRYTPRHFGWWRNVFACGTDALRTGRIVPTCLRFFATTFAALFFGALYNLADALFVSRGVGDDAMGAVSVVLPFTILQGAAAQAIGGGAASIVSRCLGRGDRQAAGRATVTAMALFYGIAVLVSALGLLFTEPLLRLFGATDALLPMAREYFVVLLWGNVFSTGFSSIIRAEGKMRYALLIWLIPTSVDMLLNAVFIFGLGLGVRGAALSTVIGQAVSFCMAVLFFARFSGQDFRAVRPSRGFLPQIALLGLPVLVQMGGMSVITFVVNRLLGDVAGTQGVNTFAYVVRLASFGIMPFTAAAQAASPMIGFYLGAGARQRVKKTAGTACIVCALWAVLALLAVVAYFAWGYMQTNWGSTG